MSTFHSIGCDKVKSFWKTFFFQMPGDKMGWRRNETKWMCCKRYIEPNIGYKNIDAFESILVLLYCGHFLYYFVTHINLRWLTIANEQKLGLYMDEIKRRGGC